MTRGEFGRLQRYRRTRSEKEREKGSNGGKERGSGGGGGERLQRGEHWDEKERRIRVCKGEIIKKIRKQRRGGVPRAKMAVLLAARRQELLINAKKARGARWGGMVRGKGVGVFRSTTPPDFSRPPLSPLPLFFCRPPCTPMRFSNKVENTDRQCSKSYGGVYLADATLSSVRIDQARRFASPRLTSPIIILLERAASLRRLYRNGVDVCFVCTSPSGVLQRVGISKQEVGTFVITQPRVPAKQETSQSHPKVISQFSFILKDQLSIGDRLSIMERFG